MRKSWLAVGLVAILMLMSTATMAETKTRGTLDSDSVTVRNLIGKIEVVGHDGSEFEITMDIQGRDSDDVDVKIVEGRHAEWNIVFPESRDYVYPPMGRSKVSIDDESSGWLSRLFGSSRIEISGRGRGLEVWVDTTIRVPYGKTLELEHGVGDIVASDVEGEIRLSSRSGTIEVVNAEGEIVTDTGSGGITLEHVRGKIVADTGSGSVTVTDCDGESLLVDTGSGRVELDSIDVTSLEVDTGSGGVKASGITTDEATIDTGSGSVSLQLDGMGDGDFLIDTGSGGIDLMLPHDASAKISADTGSGGVSIDLSGDHSIRHRDKNEAEVRVGGGAAQVTLDTGSGGIRISQDG